MDLSFRKSYSPVPASVPRGCDSCLFSETEEIYFDYQKPQICKDGTAEAMTVRRQTAHSARLTIRAQSRQVRQAMGGISARQEFIDEDLEGGGCQFSHCQKHEHADGDPDNEGVGWGKEGEVGDGREEESWCKDGNDGAPNSPEQSILIMIMIILYIIFHLPDQKQLEPQVGKGNSVVAQLQLVLLRDS